MTSLSPETVEGTSLALESIHDVERCDGLALSMFSVCDSVADDGFEEGFEDAAGLFVDHCRKTLVLTLTPRRRGG